ncbi:MAG: preprotein translocase subunit SecE [Clostridia bacterium]|nr:preprotein translocase subunit SecE [Clostridia bacterium]MEE1125590.1 preprotein translocase subunit SecE [Acutalibacteraceae bacterium]
MAEKVEKKTTEKKVADKKVAKKKDKKPNIFARIAKYFRECKAEVKKITWPAPKSVFKNFGVVLVIMLVMGLFIFALDQGLFALLGLVMETSAG